MQNKGAIKLLAVLLTLVCLYQLSFTWKTRVVENNAKEYAVKNTKQFTNLGISKKAQLTDSLKSSYLDSVSGSDVYNFMFGLRKFTYKECKEREINLGLDLQGGMNVVLEVSVSDLVMSISNFSKDTTFQKAFELAKEKQKTSRTDFITLFSESFKEVDPNARLAAIFSTLELKDKVNFSSTNEDVIKVIRDQTNSAIDNAFKILRTRIDKFGVVQPIIQKMETAGRISVDLPGVKDPKRVRKLLQGTANLEFWETYDNSEVIKNLWDANTKVAEIESASKGNTDSIKLASAKKGEKKNIAEVADKNKLETKKDTGKKELALLEKIKEKPATEKGLKDSSKLQETAKAYPLLSILRLAQRSNGEPLPGAGVGYANFKDTAKINYYLGLKQVRSILPRDIKFVWSVKPLKYDAAGNTYELYALKITGRDGRAPLTGDVVTSAKQDFSQTRSEAEVSMSMNAEGTRIWARMTRENIGRCIAIVLDNYVCSAPRVNGEIPSGNSQITGDFTIDEAKDLANQLESGKLPAPARIISETVVGPTLGKEAIQAGLLSFIFAFLGVLLYMALYYNRAGNVANVALFANVLFLFGTITSLGTVLTLPGIAGMVLTLAMAVDGNVIIYERMREEVRAGKGLRMVVKDGFWHAYSSIIDGHVTTILTGIVLYIFGSGPIRGFAVTLIIGLLLSLFSSIFIARLMFEWMLDKNTNITLGNRFTIDTFKNSKIDFIGIRKVMYVVSGIIIGIGIVSLFIRGLDPSIEFVGGRSYIVRFDHPVITSDIRNSLTKVFNDAPEVKTFGPGGTQVKITTKFMIEDKSTKTDSIVDATLYQGLTQFLPAGLTYEKFSGHTQNKTIGELSSQKVDPVMSKDLVWQAFMAVFFGLVIIFIYIAIRFKNWKFGLGGVISLFHDTMVVITTFTLFYKILPFSMEVDQQFIAALLTIIGYSIMDTVIIFDRIREYSKLYPKRDLANNINAAINSTLGRTVNTSGITLVVLLVIFIFGGEMLQGFIFALLVGVAIGTYSSVFNATPVAYDFIMWGKPKEVAKPAEVQI
jgi:SecD/SecF fusion protein